jgi:hypothetical protein
LIYGPAQEHDDGPKLASTAIGVRHLRRGDALLDHKRLPGRDRALNIGGRRAAGPTT